MLDGHPFKNSKPLIGMIHLSGSNGDIVSRALKEIEIYEKEGIDGAIIENHDCQDMNKLRTVLHESRNGRLQRGVNILPNEFGHAFGLAQKYGCSFIQVDYVAGRYDRNIHGIDVLQFTQDKRYYEGIRVLGGVHPKYYVPYSDLKTDLDDGRSLADAIVVTGEGTGKETPLDKIKTFRRHLGAYPLYIGAGLTPENAINQLRIADGAIVGSCLKKDGDVHNPVDAKRVRDLVHVVKTLRPRA